MAINFNNSGSIEKVKYGDDFLRHLYYDSKLVWVETIATYSVGSIPDGVASFTCSRASSSEPSAIKSVTNGSALYYGDIITFSCTSQQYWTASVTTEHCVVTNDTPGSVIDTLYGATRAGLTATRNLRSPVRVTKPTGPLSMTVKYTNTSGVVQSFVTTSTTQQTLSNVWQGSTISWAVTGSTITPYYMPQTSGSIAAGTSAVNFTPTRYLKNHESLKLSSTKLSELGGLAWSSRGVTKSFTHELIPYIVDGVEIKVSGTATFNSLTDSSLTSTVTFSEKLVSSSAYTTLAVSNASSTGAVANVQLKLGYATATNTAGNYVGYFYYALNDNTGKIATCNVTITDVLVNVFSNGAGIKTPTNYSITDFTYGNNLVGFAPHLSSTWLYIDELILYTSADSSIDTSTNFYLYKFTGSTPLFLGATDVSSEASEDYNFTDDGYDVSYDYINTGFLPNAG